MPDPNSIEDEWHALLFGVRRSALYHNKRVQFFDRSHKYISFFTLISGFGTITTLMSAMDIHITMIAAAIVSILSAIDLIFTPANQARLHNELKRRFVDLERNIIVKNASQKDLVTFTSKRLLIENDEPPALRVLDVICHNDLMRSMGYDKADYKKVTWVQRFCADLFDFRLHSID